MAELDEEIIIIDESDAAGYNKTEEAVPLEESSQKNKTIIFGIIGIIAILLMIITLILSLGDDEKPKEDFSLDFIEERLSEDSSKPIELSRLENMIAKANYLYSNGSHEKALYLYEKIAQFSESVSQYNLGVAQLKNKQYDTALKSFSNAINNGEKRCVSAINAAVCSLHLEDEKSFQYYLDLAYAHLPQEIDAPLYSYYYSIIQYYKNNYIEALSALKNSTTDEYPDVQKHLSTRISALFDNNYDAIESLEKNYKDNDAFSLGILYARIGNIELADKYLNEAIQNNIEPIRSALALSYIYLKSGKIMTAGSLIQNTTDMFPEEVYKPYPIKVKLKEELFDTQKAQKIYRDEVYSSRLNKYQKIFYFSPYKIFNANSSLQDIKKGTTNIYIDSADNAKIYLKKSASTSSVNKGIVKAIKMALNFKTRDANTELQKLVKIQPKHSILHYNLGLTYAQMGDIQKAYKHFLTSYHLDAKNYLSGIYAVMTAQLLDKEHLRLKTNLKEYISIEEESEEINLLRTILYIADNNTISAVDWLNNDYKQKTFYIALEAIIATELKSPVAKKATTTLITLFPQDILPHMMYIDAHFNDLEPKKYAYSVLNYLKDIKLSYKDLYYGPYITRYLYTRQNLNIGRLFYLRKQLRDVLESTDSYTQELNSALALACLFDKAYEESYVLYNHLIDDLKVRDANTLFMGAVASTAAQHHANAIALLELSKMKDKSFKDSRYALGLLYLEEKNNRGATIQFKQLGDDGFESNYFNFDIDTDLLFEQKERGQKES